VDDAVHIGGLSITGCLNDFSLHVFHPYGGGRKNKPEEMFFSPLRYWPMEAPYVIRHLFVNLGLL
jgi:hypothetical protein